MQISQTKKVRFGIVGAGSIAQTYAQAFEQSAQAVVAGVADVRLQAAEALAERLKCKAYDCHEDMARDAQLEAAIVCTPPTSHEEICLTLLRQGVHVLCEKPLSLTSESARKMLATATQVGVNLTMASKFRYVDDVVRARSIMISGIIGDVILFENAFTSHVEMSSRWNSNRQISGGGVLIDNGSHSFDLMRYFFGPLSEVQVVEGKRSQGLSVEETVRIFVRSSTGIMGSVDLSWSINKELESYLNIYGSEGTISVGWKESKYRHASSRNWIVFGNGYDKVIAFRNQITNFCNAITDGEPLVITAEDALASVEVIEAAYAALERSHWTSVGNGELSTTLCR